MQDVNLLHVLVFRVLFILFVGKLKIFPKTERVIAFEGERVTLTCEYQGGQRLDVTWSSTSGRDMKKSGFVIGSIVQSGAYVLTKVDISKSRASFSDSGKYDCTAGPFAKSVILEVYQGRYNVRSNPLHGY